MLYLENEVLALAGVAQWIEHGLQTKGALVRFPVGAHAWVAGQVPSGGHVRGNHTLMFPCLSFSLPSPLSKNKEIKLHRSFFVFQLHFYLSGYNKG